MKDDKRKILWADDEIDLLRAHHRFLDDKGYAVTPVSNGQDAIALITQEPFDIVQNSVPGNVAVGRRQSKRFDPAVCIRLDGQRFGQGLAQRHQGLCKAGDMRRQLALPHREVDVLKQRIAQDCRGMSEYLLRGCAELLPRRQHATS